MNGTARFMRSFFLWILLLLAIGMLTQYFRDWGWIAPGTFMDRHAAKLLFAGVFLLLVIVATLRRQGETVGQAAENIVRRCRVGLDLVPKLSPAEEKDFAGLDRAYYETVGNELVAAGFNPLGDFRDETSLRSLPHVRGVYRVFLDEKRETFAVCLHYAQRKTLPSGENATDEIGVPVREDADFKILNFLSQGSDGNFFTTSRADAPRGPIFAPEILETVVPDTLRIPLILVHHQAQIQKYGPRPKTFGAIEDYQYLVSGLFEAARRHRDASGAAWYAEFFRRLGQEKNGAKVLPHIARIVSQKHP